MTKNCTRKPGQSTLSSSSNLRFCKRAFGKALDRIAELERRPAKELKKIPELERKLAKALKKISELERKLAQHDNAHTPSSKKAIGQKAKPQHGKPQQNGNGKSGHGKTARRAEGTQGSHVQACPNAL